MVVRVQAARPPFQIVGGFVIVVTEQALPARRGVSLVGYYVPIPESVAGAAHRKFEPLLASAKGGDVAAHGVDQRLTGDAVGGPRDPALPTVLRAVAVLESGPRFARGDSRSLGQRRGPVVGVDELGVEGSHQFIAGPAEGLLPRGIQLFDVVVEADGTQQIE